MSKELNIIGIDPGKEGAFVVLRNGEMTASMKMPLNQDREVDFDAVADFLGGYADHPTHVYLERAVPMAMGSKHAFNYGRDFAKLEVALHVKNIPTTYVEPNKWSKVMTEGISKELKAKIRSRLAVERLFPKEAKTIPTNKNGKMDEGIMEALLIAGYGQRKMVA